MSLRNQTLHSCSLLQKNTLTVSSKAVNYKHPREGHLEQRAVSANACSFVEGGFIIILFLLFFSSSYQGFMNTILGAKCKCKCRVVFLFFFLIFKCFWLLADKSFLCKVIFSIQEIQSLTLATYTAKTSLLISNHLKYSTINGCTFSGAILFFLQIFLSFHFQ